MDNQKGSRGLSRNASAGSRLSEAGCAEAEEDVEPSSSHLLPLHQTPDEQSQPKNEDLQNDLDEFRSQWKKEVTQTETMPESVSEEPEKAAEDASHVLNKAVSLYMAGMQLEQQGQLYEAMMKYRQALQTEPSVEDAVRGILVSQHHQKYARDRLDDNGNMESPADSESESETVVSGDSEREDVLARLQQLSVAGGPFCRPATPHSGRHISCLPSEVVQLILRWVVSSDVDVRSLEMVGLVCRGLYQLSRDPAIWRRICRRVLGDGSLELTSTITWRELYLSRPHPLFGGCYISRASYIRSGEPNGYQDANYRPWHMVHYYRYLRLFSDGVLVMLTTADEPASTVSQLLHRQPQRGATVSGHWRLKAGNIFAVLAAQREKVRPRGRPGRNRRGRDKLAYDPGEQTFHIELEVLPMRRGHHQLSWQSYRILTRYLNGNESWQTINLGDQFPPFTFSRVRSYAAVSEAPL